MEEAVLEKQKDIEAVLQKHKDMEKFLPFLDYYLNNIKNNEKLASIRKWITEKNV